MMSVSAASSSASNSLAPGASVIDAAGATAVVVVFSHLSNAAKRATVNCAALHGGDVDERGAVLLMPKLRPSSVRSKGKTRTAVIPKPQRSDALLSTCCGVPRREQARAKRRAAQPSRSR
jgi:hypothetical protein